MKKGKLTLTITLGIVCFVLVATMFIQFKMVSKTDIAEIENMRETELRAQIAKIKIKQEELQKKYDETITKKEEYINSINENEDSIELLEQELEQAEMRLGLTDVTGDGIIVTLTDNESEMIEVIDIIELINELRLAGAEAISINDERVIATTDFANIDYKYIYMNGKERITSPYIVKVIGDQNYLESGLNAKQYGYIDNMTKALGKTVTLERKNNIKIGKYEGEISLNNITE